MAKTYHFSPFGIASHPWLNKPDTKFQADGVYKVGLVLSGPDAQKFKELVDAEADAAYARYFEAGGQGEKIAPKEHKSWSVYRPYSEETDDNDNPTGYITFDFKQNAKIKLKDGTTKDIQVGIKDAKNKDIHKPVFGGSELRTMFAFRDIPMKSLKQVGTRLDFAAVQVKNLKQSTGPAFGEVEGGYEEPEGASNEPNHEAGVGEGDY